MNKKSISVIVGLLTMLFFFACGESDEIIREKFHIILEDDLSAIIDGIEKEALLDEPFYEIVFYETHEGRYTRRAEVKFYFLRNVNAKIVRRYRYHSSQGKWDRFRNEYRFYSEKKASHDN
ncbi:hypothetical protein QA601_04815 [Chitinispirillales bacterium ANBcel5]|uniref:hypothetical protein n=1 Tax=Cellulosispirillum alkaliphilum TaxID=3039283 RepID=UPI002A5032B6|nr:hypothetical protein [Chitinispirillales bacterium ANBcel5]